MRKVILVQRRKWDPSNEVGISVNVKAHQASSERESHSARRRVQRASRLIEGEARKDM